MMLVHEMLPIGVVTHWKGLASTCRERLDGQARTVSVCYPWAHFWCTYKGSGRSSWLLLLLLLMLRGVIHIKNRHN